MTLFTSILAFASSENYRINSKWSYMSTIWICELSTQFACMCICLSNPRVSPNIWSVLQS